MKEGSKMEWKKSITNFVTVFMATLSVSCLSSALLSRETDKARATLKGLKGIYVILSFGTEKMTNLKKLGLIEEVIKIDVEQQIKAAAINIISKKKDQISLPGIPQLVVQVVGYSVLRKGYKEKGIACFIQTELNQKTLLGRDPDINSFVGTWARSVVGLGYTDEGIVADIRNAVKDCVDAFIKAYQSVNPKGGK
jgi:hypothetical protein